MIAHQHRGHVGQRKRRTAVHPGVESVFAAGERRGNGGKGGLRHRRKGRVAAEKNHLRGRAARYLSGDGYRTARVRRGERGGECALQGNVLAGGQRPRRHRQRIPRGKQNGFGRCAVVLRHVGGVSGTDKSRRQRVVGPNALGHASQGIHRVQPVVGEGVGHPKFQAAARVGVVQIEGFLRVGEGQVLPVDVVPQVDVGRVAEDAGLLLHFQPKLVRVEGVVTQVQGAAVDGVEFNPKAGRNIAGPKRAVVVAVAPHPRNQGVRLRGPKVALALVKPVFFHRALLRHVQVNAQIPDGVVPRHAAPVDQRRVELHAFRRRLLIVALREGGKSIGPGVAGVGAETAQIRKEGVVAPGRRGVAHEQVDHGSPGGGPTRFKLLHKRRGVDEVAPMKVVVVQVQVLSVPGRIAQQRRPRGVVVKQKGHFARLVVQPVFQTFLNRLKQKSKSRRILRQLRGARGLDQSVHLLPLVVAVRPGGQRIVLQQLNLGTQFQRLKPGAVGVHVRQGGQNSVEGVLNGKRVGSQALEGSPHGGVGGARRRCTTGREGGPLVRQQAHQQDAVQSFFNRYVCGKLGGHHGRGRVVGPLRAGVHGHHISVRRKLRGGGGHAGGGERQKGQRPVVFPVQRAGVGVPGLHPNAPHRRVHGKVRPIPGIFNAQHLVGHRCGSLVYLHRGDVRAPFGEVQKRHTQPGGCTKLLGSGGPIHRYRPIRVVRHPRLRRVQPTDAHHHGLNVVDGSPRNVGHHQAAVLGFEGERVGE